MEYFFKMVTFENGTIFFQFNPFRGTGTAQAGTGHIELK